MNPLVTITAWIGIAGSAAHAVTCEQVYFKDAPYTICEVDLTREKLSLFLRDEHGEIYGHFSAIDSALARLDGKGLKANIHGRRGAGVALLEIDLGGVLVHVVSRHLTGNLAPPHDADRVGHVEGQGDRFPQ